MKSRLSIYACSFLIPEISQVIKNSDYSDVQLFSFSADCSSKALNQITFPKIQSKLHPNSDIIVIGSSCYSNHLTEQENIKNVKVFQLCQCFEMILNPDTIYHLIAQGNYIVTNGWLKNYQKTIQKWGFDKSTSRSFFQESLKSILLLDTKIPWNYMPNLLALSDYMGIPYNILPVGLSYCQKILETIVLDWRIQKKDKEHRKKYTEITKKSADHQIIFNQLEPLVKLTNEPEIIQIAFELINVLFAPSLIKYHYQKNNNYETLEFKGFVINTDLNEDNSFSIEIKNSGDLLGIFEIQGIQFKNYKKQYQEMGLIISQIFGMAIANARRYFELEQSKFIISEREKELQKTTKSLKELNDIKDKFFSIISHDLKSPMSSLLQFTEMLYEDFYDFTEDEKRKFIGIIKDSSMNIFDLLVNLLEWSRSQVGSIIFQPTQFNLNDLIRPLLRLIKLQSNNKNISIINNINGELDLIADPNLIKTILRNLISNALKFTPNGGKIEIGYLKNFNENEIQIYIRDNGLGMSDDILNKLFKIENIVSTEGINKETGTGLGLVLCKEFVEIHGGKIWVDSQLGTGSTFWFTIPQISSSDHLNHLKIANK